jgi:hypothetical protein
MVGRAQIVWEIGTSENSKVHPCVMIQRDQDILLSWSRIILHLITTSKQKDSLKNPATQIVLVRFDRL